MNTILKKHIVSLIAIIIIGVIMLGGIVFLSLSMKTKMAKVIETKERIASYQKNKKAFNEEVNKLKSLENRLTELESKIITKENVPTLLSSLEALAQKNGTTFEITSVQTPIENDKTKLLIEFNTKGSYNQIQSFLGELQHQPFEIKIAKLFLFSEQGEPSREATSGRLLVTKSKTPTAPKEKSWQGVTTIEILSF
jgi:Tfp pilus assembly protein PilO